MRPVSKSQIRIISEISKSKSLVCKIKIPGMLIRQNFKTRALIILITRPQIISQETMQQVDPSTFDPEMYSLLFNAQSIEDSNANRPDQYGNIQDTQMGTDQNQDPTQGLDDDGDGRNPTVPTGSPTEDPQSHINVPSDSDGFNLLSFDEMMRIAENIQWSNPHTPEPRRQEGMSIHQHPEDMPDVLPVNRVPEGPIPQVFQQYLPPQQPPLFQQNPLPVHPPLLPQQALPHYPAGHSRWVHHDPRNVHVPRRRNPTGKRPGKPSKTGTLFKKTNERLAEFIFSQECQEAHFRFYFIYEVLYPKLYWEAPVDMPEYSVEDVLLTCKNLKLMREDPAAFKIEAKKARKRKRDRLPGTKALFPFASKSSWEGPSGYKKKFKFEVPKQDGWELIPEDEILEWKSKPENLNDERQSWRVHKRIVKFTMLNAQTGQLQTYRREDYL